MFNHSTKATYNGINILMLWLSASTNSFSSDAWLTYKQAQALGGNVIKGSKGTRIIFYKTYIKEDKETGEEKTLPVLKWSTVFNLDQIENLEIQPEEPQEDLEPIDFSEYNFIDQAIEKTGAEIKHGGDRAFYAPSKDFIQIPEKQQFHTAENYYHTLLHELTHWTGVKSRLDRKGYYSNAKSDHAYEELVAELGSVFLSAEFNILGDLENHVAYMESWLKALKNDKHFIFKASSQASKVFNYVNELVNTPDLDNVA